MRQELISSARRIAGELKTAENGCDAALANHARLVATLLDARRDAGLPARTGRDTVGRVIEAVAHAAKARELLLDTHEDLARLNLRELAAGDMSECPEDWKLSATLSLVENEANAA